MLATNGIGFDTAVYNIVPPPEDAGLLGFKIFLFDTPQFTVLGARTGGDYGLDSDTTSIFHGLFPLEALQEVLWGVPAAPSHDRLRINPRNSLGGPSFPGSLCDSSGQLATSDPESVDEFCIGNFVGFTPLHSNALSAPFLQNPTTCDTTLSSTLEVLSYDSGLTSAEYPWPKLTGCDQLSFNPSLYAQPTTSTTDSPSGMDVDLTVPQQVSPTVPSPTELRRATVTLPQGFSINPNAADGKTACQDTDASFGTTFAAHCPEFAKIGSLTIDSSALPGPLPGFVYLGQPLPGNRYRIFLVADGFATHVKLAGTVSADPVTGRLTITLNELPQSPLTAFNMHIFGSERGPLASPTRCGTYPITSVFTPWDSSLAAQTSTQYFTIESGPEGKPCPGPTRPFSPTVLASSASRSTRRPRSLLARSHALGRRPEPRRAHGEHSAGPLGDDRRGALLLRRGPGRGRRLLLLGNHRAAEPELPARRPDRHLGRGRRGRNAPGLPARQGLPRRPLQGGADLIWRRSRRPSRAHMTSATSSSARRCTSTRPTPTSPRSPTPCRRSSAASRSACAACGSASTGPTSPSTRPTARRLRSAPP